MHAVCVNSIYISISFRVCRQRRLLPIASSLPLVATVFFLPHCSCVELCRRATILHQAVVGKALTENTPNQWPAKTSLLLLALASYGPPLPPSSRPPPPFTHSRLPSTSHQVLASIRQDRTEKSERGEGTSELQQRRRGKVLAPAPLMHTSPFRHTVSRMSTTKTSVYYRSRGRINATTSMNAKSCRPLLTSCTHFFLFLFPFSVLFSLPLCFIFPLIRLTHSLFHLFSPLSAFPVCTTPKQADSGITLLLFLSSFLSHTHTPHFSLPPSFPPSLPTLN